MTPSAATELHLAVDFALPIDAVTQTFAILAKRGRGKTVTASVLTEELIGAGLPVCVIDPTGAWWGLRSSADGTAPGLPVVIFGGKHADVDLDETAGALLATIIVEERFPAVIDVSLLSKSAARRFVTDFAEKLYHSNREPLHLIVDECDLFCPQRTFAGTERLVGAMDDIVRRGRIRGLGVTLISQRPAVVNKDVLSQVECLIVLGLTGTHDIEAIDHWIRLHADEDDARKVKDSLPSLPTGTAWVWSPEWLNILQKVNIRMRRTFDSSATPRAGVTRVVPQQWATVDIGALSQRLAPAGDEPAPRRRASPGARATKPAPAAAAEWVSTAAGVTLTDEQANLINTIFADIDTKLAELAAAIAPTIHRTGWHQANHTIIPETDQVEPYVPATGARRLFLNDPVTSQSPATNAAGRQLTKAERTILTVLAQHGTRNVNQIALLSGYSHKSGGYRNALSSLRTAGYIHGRGDLAPTPAGVEALGGYEPLPTGNALVAWWAQKLSKAERSILLVLVQQWPQPVDIPRIAELTGYQPTSGGFRNALSKLRSLDLAAGRGELRANDVLGQAAHPNSQKGRS